MYARHALGVVSLVALMLSVAGCPGPDSTIEGGMGMDTGPDGSPGDAAVDGGAHDSGLRDGGDTGVGGGDTGVGGGDTGVGGGDTGVGGGDTGVGGGDTGVGGGDTGVGGGDTGVGGGDTGVGGGDTGVGGGDTGVGGGDAGDGSVGSMDASSDVGTGPETGAPDADTDDSGLDAAAIGRVDALADIDADIVSH